MGLDDFDFDGVVRELSDGTAIEDGRAPQLRDFVPSAQPFTDEFQMFMERFRHAAVEAGVADEFYHHVFDRREALRLQQERAARVGNPVSGTDKNLGTIQALSPDVAIVSAPALRWQGEDAETGPVAVTLGVLTPIVAGSLVLRPFAYIKWGGYGVPFQAEVDIGTGRQFVVNASMIEVDVALDALSAANTAQAQLSASLSFKPNVRTSALIRTRYIDALAQNASKNIVVPPFAVGLLPVQMSDTSGQVQLDFVDSSSAIRYSLLVNNGSQVTPIPLSSDIVQVTVTNKTANAQHIRLPFELSI